MTYRKNNVFLTKEELAAKATRNESVSKRMSSSDETTLVRTLSRSCFFPSPLMVCAPACSLRERIAMVSRAGVSVCRCISPRFALRRAHNACVSISAQANSDGSGEARGCLHPAGVRWARWSWCGRGRRRELARAIHGCLPMNHNKKNSLCYYTAPQIASISSAEASTSGSAATGAGNAATSSATGAAAAATTSGGSAGAGSASAQEAAALKTKSAQRKSGGGNLRSKLTF